MGTTDSPDNQFDQQGQTVEGDQINIGQVGEVGTVGGDGEDQVNIGQIERADTVGGEGDDQIVIGQIDTVATIGGDGDDQITVGPIGRVEKLLLDVPRWLQIVVASTLALLLLLAVFGVDILRSAFVGNATMPAATFNIAVADIGVLDEGRMRETDFGRTASETIFNRITREYADGVLTDIAQQDVTVWHDSLPRRDMGTRLGIISGATAQARSDSAAELAERLDADMVIYGYLTEEDSREALVTEFFFNVPKLRSEIDAMAGAHRLGIPIALRVSPTADPVRASELLKIPLGQRAQALAWLTAGLTKDSIGDPEGALAIFQQAETDLSDWADEDGKEVLYTLIGREAFFLREYDIAFEALNRALAINPAYPNAHLTLGSTHYDHAQLHFLRPADGAAVDQPSGGVCSIDPAAIGRSAATFDEALSAIETADFHFKQVIEFAPESVFPPLAPLGSLMLGQNGRLAAFTSLVEGDDQLAQTRLDASAENLQLALGQLQSAENGMYRAMAQDGLGGAFELQANIAERADDRQAAIEAWATGKVHYQLCLAERDAIPDELRDFILEDPVFICGCEVGLARINEITGASE